MKRASKPIRVFIGLSVGVISLCASVCLPATPRIYWSEKGPRQIKRANVDGTHVETVIDTPVAEGLPSIALSTVSGRIYWSEWGAAGGRLMWGHLDGTGAEALAVNGAASPHGVALDRGAASVFYAQPSDCPCGKIIRTRLDGSDSVALLYPDSPHGLVLDLSGGRMYWSDDAEQAIFSSALDGSDTQPVLGGVLPFALAVDPAGGKLYWTEFLDTRVRRANLDGSGVEDLAGEENPPGNPTPPRGGIAVDPQGGKMYWADGDVIRVADLDGSNPSVAVSGLDEAVAVALDLGEGSIMLTLEAEHLNWTQPTGAQRYDVIRGSLGFLRRSGGDFAASMEACVVDDTLSASVDAIPSPPPGYGEWFLVRGVTAIGEGTYDTYQAGQAAGRDAAIAASGLDCPSEFNP